MDVRITLRKFSGCPTQDPDRFILDFGAYCNHISDRDNRKIAASQLHLNSPAQTWFCCLNDAAKSSWKILYDAFQNKYSSGDNNSVLLVDTHQFHNLRSIFAHEIEDFYGKVLDKGRKLFKIPQELLLKFIQGLPLQLSSLFELETQMIFTQRSHLPK